MSTADCIDKLTFAESRVGNFKDLLLGKVGESTATVVNTLLAHYSRGGKVEHRIVSDYAARSIAIHLGPDSILRFASVLTTNPAMEGHVLKCWVLSSVSQRGLYYWPRDEGNKRRSTQAHQWGAGVSCVDPAEDQLLHFCFVQIMRAKTHSFKMQPFKQLLRTLKPANIHLASVELIFVVPLKQLEEFKLPVSDGHFKKVVVNAAFAGNQLIASHVRVVGVDFRLEIKRAPNSAPKYLRASH